MNWCLMSQLIKGLMQNQEKILLTKKVFVLNITPQDITFSAAIKCFWCIKKYSTVESDTETLNSKRLESDKKVEVSSCKMKSMASMNKWENNLKIKVVMKNKLPQIKMFVPILLGQIRID